MHRDMIVPYTLRSVDTVLVIEEHLEHDRLGPK